MITSTVVLFLQSPVPLCTFPHLRLHIRSACPGISCHLCVLYLPHVYTTPSSLRGCLCSSSLAKLYLFSAMAPLSFCLCLYVHIYVFSASALLDRCPSVYVYTYSGFSHCLFLCLCRCSVSPCLCKHLHNLSQRRRWMPKVYGEAK